QAATDPARAHPLLGAPLVRRSRDAVYEARLRPEVCWPLAEHRVAAGGYVLPGTGYPELARAAYADPFGDRARAVAIRDGCFTAPLELAAADEAGDVRVVLRRNGARVEATIASRPASAAAPPPAAFRKHASCTVEAVAAASGHGVDDHAPSAAA